MDKRRITQIITTILTNSNINGFLNGTIFKGKSKKACVPGLNCYSCPGALGSCPIGSLQAVIGSMKYNLSLYVIGIMMFFGVLFGRFICGFLCPFGLIQDLLNKIPFKKIKVNKKINNIMKYFKYVILMVFVIILPMFWVNDVGMGSPYFCKLICPSGTLTAGIPLAILNKPLRATLGFLFQWKVFILIITILLSIIIYRPFCRYICPLGAIYSVFNPISFYKMDIDKSKCNGCKACERKCKMNIEVYKNPNSLECIRCGECAKVCKQNAIVTGFTTKNQLIKNSKNKSENI
ncbi:4Fe-4S binding protein [Clostridium ihumii]|uniref:4Fe-4S binding protein n=1 Tax=Clostridium ihumii TaxID=1470356 RepID=UPI00058C7356|nr:4Fe-4S binding protein [Clostridium ihumii]